MPETIGLYNLEHRYTNIALEKIRLYYSNRGVKVIDVTPAESVSCDIVYASSLFDWTSKKYVYPNMITGGTGFDPTTQLPPEIDIQELHINKGFTTRGCFRNCKFCLVRLKEGTLRVVGTLLDLWDKINPQIILYDNNILGLPDHFSLICDQARQYNLILDFNQGLDHRCLNPEIVDEMKSIRHHEYRFAFDHPSYINSVDKAITLLQDKGIMRCNWYVLVGFDTTPEQDLYRLNYLRARNQIAYVQRYHQSNMEKHFLTALARWVNQHHLYRGMTWEQYLKHPDNKHYKDLLWTAKLGEIK